VDRAEESETGSPLLTLDGPDKFCLAAGEIVGIYGLLGAGRTELLELLAGLRPPGESRIRLDGSPIDHLSLRQRIQRGIMVLSEDRKLSGLLPNFSVRDNITIANLPPLVLSPKREDASASAAAARLQIRAASVRQSINALSGGNQQKVLLARMLETRPRVLLLDEPSRGVDVGARAEIFSLIRRLAREGMAILFTSSDTQEVLSLAQRVLVMATGRITADLTGPEATPESLVRAAGAVHARA
jgi:erythritol transport system ATP-binding protein